MLPPDGGSEFNRLVHEKSPYLRQHARNPVDWHPWGDEAFERAKREDKPVFLSIGYSSCHWCHVMERESFEDKEVARLLNEHFVSIKVDREERPDVDEVYMKAVQLLTGRGGWPLSAFLTPDRRPFLGGTYFPPEDTGGRAGFKTLLAHVTKIYGTRRDEVEQAAGRLAAAVKGSSAARRRTPSAKLDRQPVESALRELGFRFDEHLGGFSRAPKFPPHGSLRLLLYEYERTKDGPLLEMATRTLDAMAAGGIRDHLGGGFHRYSTDARWLLPHFEKMLYDNAQLSRIYVRAHLLTGSDEYRRVAVDTYEWVLREMTGAEGGFFSALDADSEGEEGKFYVWRRDEILAALGEKEGEVFSRAYGVEEEGNFHDQATGERPGTNVLHLALPVAELARALARDPSELRSALQKGRAKLLQLRGKRVRPGLDDKVIAGWNGLMIGSLAYGGRHLREPRYVRAAEKAARFILKAMRRDGLLLRAYRDGSAGPGAFLDDYAYLADGLLDLHEATREGTWLDEARSLADAMTEHFAADEAGGFFFTSDEHEALLARSKDPFDKAIPSGNAVAARVLVRLDRLTGEGRYAEAARKTLAAFRGHMQRAPRAAESLVHALALHLDGAADARAVSGPVAAEAYLSASRVAPGGEAKLALRLTMAGGWHVNSSAPGSGDLVASSVALTSKAAVKLGRVDYPQGKKVTLGSSTEPLSIYEGTVWIRSSITVGAGAKVGPARFDLEVRIQPCSDRECLAPVTLRLPVEFEIVDERGPYDRRHPEVFRLLERAKGQSR